MTMDISSVRRLTTGISLGDHDRRPAMPGMVSQPRTLVLSEVRLYREALRQELVASGAVDVVGVTGSDDAAGQLARLVPDVLVVDATTGPPFLALAWRLKELMPSLRIVVVMSGRDDAELLRWAEAGIRGYVDRNNSAADLVAAVLHAMRGEVLCSPRVVALLTRRIATLSAERRKYSELDGLTPREREVLALVSQGLPNKRIAQQLGIGETTTKNHVHSILDKLGLKSRHAAAAFHSTTQHSLTVSGIP